MRKALFALPLLASALIFPRIAHADTIDDFTLNNTITFSLPVPLPGAAVNTDDFRTQEFLADINGHNTLATLDLFSSSFGGGFNFTFFFPGGQTSIIGLGDQLFSGTIDDPTPLIGTFFLNDSNGGIDTLKITSEAASTPEPSSFALFGTGALGLAGIVRRRFLPLQ
jgi:PEP-CTERM motif